MKHTKQRTSAPRPTKALRLSKRKRLPSRLALQVELLEPRCVLDTGTRPITEVGNNVANPSCVDFNFANHASESNALLFGFSAGGGMDVMVAPNVFARGELEFIQFAPISHIVTNIVSARVGAGVRF